MKSYKKVFSLLAIFLISFLSTSPVFASFSGVLQVSNLGTTPTAAIVTMSSSSLSAGQTATVTFTFPAAPISFTSSDITASNGTISGLAVTGDPKVYTATFTPTSSINAPTNTISVAAKVTMTNYSVPGNPEAIGFDGTNMWTANYGGGSVSKITPSGVVTTYGGLGGSPSGVAFDGTNIWVSNYGGGSVSKITPSGATSTYSVSGGPNDIAFDGLGHMWTANYSGNSVSEISSTGTVMHTYNVGANPYGIAFDGTNMWAANMTDSSVTKVTPTGTTTTYAVGWNPARIAFDGTNMWTANDIGSSVTKVSSSGATSTYVVSGSADPYGIAFDGTNMWTANYGANSVSEISASGTITTFNGTGFLSNPHGIAFDGTNMWISNYGGNSVTKVGFAGTGSSANYSINTIVASPAPAPVQNHGGHALVLINPMAIGQSNLDFTINGGSSVATNSLVNLGFNADSNTVKGYAVSLDPTFAGAGIQPYSNGMTGTFQLPNTSGTYTVYLEYFSLTGNHSSVISHTVSYNPNGTSVPIQSATTNSKNSFTRTFMFGSSGSDVTILQKLLVSDGELVLPANSSYGNFGKMTQAALEKFQVKYGIVKAGMQGYGVFGPKTQAVAYGLLNK